jgi:hypothetical protein
MQQLRNHLLHHQSPTLQTKVQMEYGTGWQFKYLTRGGGYYFNVGCPI